MRPATMIGTEDRILNPWSMFVKKYGFLPLIGGGTTKYVLNPLCNSFHRFIAACNVDPIPSLTITPLQIPACLCG